MASRSPSAANTIERQKNLFNINESFDWLKKYPSIRFFYGDGYECLPTYGPFDTILITAAAPAIPKELVDQLRPGGQMVIPVGEKGIERMTRHTNNQDGKVQEEAFDQFSFVPIVEGNQS